VFCLLQLAQLRYGHFRHAEGSAGPGRLGVCVCPDRAPDRDGV
jgi:hypothetical protein